MIANFYKKGVARFWITSLSAALLAGGCDSLQEKPATPVADPSSTPLEETSHN